MDCALHKQGVTFVLDRAGVTGSDGPSHNGMWDMTVASIVPGLRLAAPRDGEQVKQQLREAVAVDDAPTIVRFPKGDVADPIEAARRDGTVDVLVDCDDEPEVLVVGVGSMCSTAVDVAGKLAAQGHSTMVVDPRWVLPVSDDLLRLTRRAQHVVVIEDNLVVGGIGSSVTSAMREQRQEQPVHCFGIPKRFLDHASRGQVLEEIGLTADVVSTAMVQRLGPRD